MKIKLLKLLSFVLAFTLILSACGEAAAPNGSSSSSRSVSESATENESTSTSDKEESTLVITEVKELLNKVPQELLLGVAPENIIVTDKTGTAISDLTLSTLQGLAAKKSETQFLIKSGDGF